MSWSIDGQTPEFLAATRMVSLDDGIVAHVLECLQLKAGMRVLDVGSGSGEYCFRLGSAVKGVEFVGLEYDTGFVDFANTRAVGNVGYPFEEPNPANSYRFVCGDGLDLPFRDGEFDAVISHTYLTAVPDWASALAEMCRVCKPGGTVSSITSMTDDFYGTGSIGLFNRLFDPEGAALLRLAADAKASASTSMSLTSGIAPRKAPVAFDWIGLEHVRCTPLAHYFCVSDAGIDDARKRRFVDLLYAVERKQLERLRKNPDASAMLSDAQWSAYEQLLEARREELMQPAGNREWDWYGNSSLLVCGTVPTAGPAIRCEALRNESRIAREALAACEEAGLAVSLDMKQLGPGRCVMAAASAGSEQPECVYGFNPPQAILESCGKMACRALQGETALPDRLRVLAEQERRREAAEERFCASGIEVQALPDLSTCVLFQFGELWETVADASLNGIDVRFKEAETENGVIVVCEAESDGRRASALASHDTAHEAATRALARCIGSMSKSRG